MIIAQYDLASFVLGFRDVFKCQHFHSIQFWEFQVWKSVESFDLSKFLNRGLHQISYPNFRCWMRFLFAEYVWVEPSLGGAFDLGKVLIRAPLVVPSLRRTNITTPLFPYQGFTSLSGLHQFLINEGSNIVTWDSTVWYYSNFLFVNLFARKRANLQYSVSCE